VSALGKVCLKHGDLPNLPNALAVWLQYLPLKSDLEEAVVVNEQLCVLLERYDPPPPPPRPRCARRATGRPSDATQCYSRIAPVQMVVD
jgi:hypothetical protein